MLLCWLMKSFFIEKKIHYTGKTSCISWAKSHFDLEGDVVLASVGTSPRPKKTKKLASVSSRQPMLHLWVEHSALTQREALFCQSLLAGIVADTLRGGFFRSGAELYYDQARLSQSEFTYEEGRAELYLGLCIQSTEPFMIGLDDFDIPARELSFSVLQQYCEDIHRIQGALL